jgi:hypothetical protein
VGNYDSKTIVKYRNGLMMEESCKDLKVRNEIIRQKMMVSRIVVERLGNHMLMWNGRMVGVDDNRWPERIMTVTGRKKTTRTTGSNVGNGSGEDYEAEGFNV